MNEPFIIKSVNYFVNEASAYLIREVALFRVLQQVLVKHSLVLTAREIGLSATLA